MSATTGHTGRFVISDCPAAETSPPRSRSVQTQTTPPHVEGYDELWAHLFMLLQG